MTRGPGRVTGGFAFALLAPLVACAGYERKADVTAGGTAEIALTPDTPGVFVLELVENRLKLLELEIS